MRMFSAYSPWVLYGQICLLIKSFCKSQISICSASVVSHRHAESSEKFSVAQHRSPSEVHLGDALLSCLNSHTVKGVLFTVSTVPHFSHFLVFFIGDCAV